MAICWNTTYAIEWKGSGDLGRILEVLAADRLPISRQRPIITVSISDENSGPLPYYIATHGMHWLSHIRRSAPDRFPLSDYYIVEYDGYDQVDPANWTLLYHSAACNASLYRDERFRSKEPITVYHGALDMGSPGQEGACTDHPASGKQCLRFDRSSREPERLQWTVPEGWDGSNVLATGSVLVRQANDENWVTLWITVNRDGKTVEKRDVASYWQMVHYEQWNRVGVELRTNIGLHAGDSITFAVWPYTLDAVFDIDDMDFRVLRE
jgi:hypothetical protein